MTYKELRDRLVQSERDNPEKWEEAKRQSNFAKKHWDILIQVRKEQRKSEN